MRTLVRDFSRDQKDTIKGMFTEDEWDAIYSAMGDFQDYGDKETDLARSITNRISELFKSEVQFQEYGEGGVVKHPIQTSRQTVTQNPYKGFFHVYNRYMNNSILNEFYPQISQKGYTMSDISVAMESSISQEVPDAFKDRYSTYEEYKDALHDFLNGI